MVTFPLKRIRSTSDVHPLLRMQQHINRGQRRLAQMTGRELPSDHQLYEKLRKRADWLGTPLEERFYRVGLAGAPHNSKRFNRQGLDLGHPIDLNDLSPTVSSIAKEVESKVNSASANDDAAETMFTPTASNSIGLDIESDDVGYMATVSMGTPAREFLLLVDSGSADTWVASQTCQGEDGGDCGDHVYLGSSVSSTFEATAKTFNITYGSGQISGRVISDTLEFAGFTLKNHSFGVATVESSNFASNSTPFDGLMGLALSSLSSEGVPTPPEALVSAGLIDQAIVSFKLARISDATNDGEITFGGLDSSKYVASTLTTVDNVSDEGFWEASMDSVLVDGTSLGLSGRTAILDTGTTLVIAPAADALAVHQSIVGAEQDSSGGFFVPCDTNATVTLVFGGTEFSIASEDLAYSVASTDDGEELCTSGIQSGSVGSDTEWLVGDVFLTNVYFSTNVQENTLSLANLSSS
ncbi:aspartic peptidase A1 [Fistulina hepatica ATCC 64428]|nr:aspartic peptidase A1 [Fistulina hepatica ATCC 64428]